MNLIKAIGGLAVVNGFSQIAQLAAQPLLGHIYSPEQFGLLAQVIVISSILAIFGTLQIHNYLVLVKGEGNLRRMVGVAVALTNVLCVIAFPFLLLLSSVIYGPGHEGLEGLAVVTCMLVMTSCYGSLQRGIQTATGDFRCMMRYTIVRSVVLIAAQILFGLEGVENGLIYGLLLGEIGAQIIVGMKSLSLIKNMSISEVVVSVKEVFRAHADFIFSGSLQELVSMAVFLLPLYLISRVYGHTSGGQFAMAHKMAWAPILLLAQSISPVFMKYASNMEKSALRKNLFLNLNVSFVLFLLLSGLSLFFVKSLFLKFFSDTWNVSADMCALVGVFSASFLCALPYRMCYRILNRQRIQLYVDSVALIFLFFLFSKSHYISLMMMVQAVVLVGVVQNIFVSILAKIYLHFSINNGFK